jgi:hypothetical protein
MKKYIYSPHHQGLVEAPLMEKPDIKDNKFWVTIDFLEKEFNAANEAYTSWLSSPPIYKVRLEKPKVICYCGSLRKAKEAFQKAEYESLMKGEIALLPCCMFVDIERKYGLTSEYKQKADEQHKRKIDMADEVFILNVGGYIGESTHSEINYAISIGKPVKYLESSLELNK